MSDNTGSAVTGQVEIADVLKILDDGIKEATKEEKEHVELEDYESALSMQHEKLTLRWVRGAILRLERKP